MVQARAALVACALVGLLTAPVWAQTADHAPPKPQTSAQDQAKPSSAEANPFPEAESQAAADEARGADKAASSGPAETPKDTEAESSSRSRLKGVDVLGDREAHASNGVGGVVNDPKLAKEDIRIGQLYMGTGDYPGAYARFKEATEVAPGNTDAVFYLAQAARKSAHLDEAAASYQLYLEADPKGKHSKDAKKALNELAGK